MAIDYSVLALPKPKPRVVVRATKKRTHKAAMRKAFKAVDRRDKAEDAERPVCFITGRYLSTNTTDEWTFRDRAHLEPKSKAKKRRDDPANMLSVSRAVHALIDSSALLLLDKRGREAKSITAIDHVAWNRRMVAKGEEPCRLRKGLPVRELPA